jgi:hypothetical protein
LRLARRVQAMCHAEDSRRMRNEVPEPINSGKSASGHAESPRVGPW